MAGADIITRLVMNSSNYQQGLKDAKKQMKDFQSTVQTAKSVMGSLGAVTAFVGISASIGAAVKTSIQFEKSLSNMKALTGATAKDLDYFKDEAIRLGSTTTQTASEVVEAFKLIGSKKAELLQSKEALTQVTESAITLAEAAGVTVPEAANALAGALNQFGASSAHADEYINILAAASQKGAADVVYLNKAIEKSGGTASSVGVKFHELVAAIEAIAPKITDASEAGTTLRNVFLSLEKKGTNDIKPSIVGITKAVENLANMHMTATEYVKLFGKENVTSAMALVNAKDTMIELQKAIVDTNTAYEQQAINNDNLEGSIKGLQSAWEGFVLTLNGSNGILKDIVDSLTEAVTQAKELLMSKEKLQEAKMTENAKTDGKETQKRLEERVKSGMTVQEAYEAEKKNIGYMYPNAAAYESGAAKKRVDNAVAAMEFNPFAGKFGAWTPERKQEQINAKKAYEQATVDYYGKQSATNALESWYKEQVAEKKPEEAKTEGVAAATKKGKGSKKATGEQIAFVNSGLNYDTALGDKYMKYLESGELPTTKLKVEIEEEIEDDGVVDALFEQQAEAKQKAEQALKEYQKQLNKTGSAAQSVGKMFNSAGQMAEAFGSKGLATMMNIGGNVAEMISELSSLAIANGVAQGAKMPFPANLAAMATVVSTITSIIASLNYADGGVVPGSNYHDGIRANLSSGEMVINQHDQNRLFQAIKTGDFGQASGGGTAEVRAEKVVMAINNWGRRTGRGIIIK